MHLNLLFTSPALELQSAPRRISVLPLRFTRCRVQTIATTVRISAPLPLRLLRQLRHGVHLLQLYMRSPDAHADSVSLAGETNRRLLRLRTPRAFMWMHRLHGGVLVLRHSQRRVAVIRATRRVD